MRIEVKRVRWGRTSLLVILFLCLLFILGGLLGRKIIKTELPLSPPRPLNVLFIGNSYTSVNSLPTIFQEIAVSAGQTSPVVDSYTPGGYTLTQHLADAKVRSLLESESPNGEHWDAVVLQEQSTTPAYAQVNQNIHDTSLASASGLYTLIKNTNPNTHVILYETWARKANLWGTSSIDPLGFGADPQEMQRRIQVWYEEAKEIMDQLGGPEVTIARVGEYWQMNNQSTSPIQLFASDGSHPDFAGSYLAGLVIFSTIYNVSPSVVSYIGSLPTADAARLKGLTSNLPNAK